MNRKKCSNCSSSKKCFRCDWKGCNECVQECCCDCSVSLCRRCRDSYDVKCGCYGVCDHCDADVDRGSDGWPCDTCEKWYCTKCRHTVNNQCKECNPDECEKCGETEPSCLCDKCKVKGCDNCISYYHYDHIKTDFSRWNANTCYFRFCEKCYPERDGKNKICPCGKTYDYK
jgi:hypothetical protein